MVEPAREELVQRRLSGVPERRVAQVVAQGNGLCQVLVQAQGPGDGPGDLRDLEGVGQARPVVVAEGRQEDLGFMLEPPEGLGMNDAVPVPLEGRPDGVRRFGPRPAFGIAAQASLGRKDFLFDGLDVFPDAHDGLPRKRFSVIIA